MKPSLSRRILSTLAAAAAVGAAIAGCSGGSSAGSSSSSSTLTYWGFASGITSKTASNAIKAFEAAHSGTHISTLVLNTDDIDVKLPSAMSSGSGPDIVYSGSDPATLGRYVKLGQVLPLGQYWAKYGWNQIPASSKARVSYDGQPDAVGNELETLGLVYNKLIFTKLGLSAPTTLQQLETEMAAIKQRDPSVTPMILACGGPCYSGLHMMHALAYASMPTKTVLATTVNGSGSYDTAAWKGMLATFASWEKNGYLSKDANGIGDANHWTPICNGTAAMMAEGTWLFSTLQACQQANPSKFQFGFVPFPVSSGRPLQAYVGTGKAWFFNKSLEKDPAKLKLALEFVASMTTPSAALSWIKNDELFPAVPFSAAKVDLSAQQRTALSIMRDTGANGGSVDVGFNNSPAETKVWVSVLQGILSGSQTPSAATQTLEAQLRTDQQNWKQNAG